MTLAVAHSVVVAEFIGRDSSCEFLLLSTYFKFLYIGLGSGFVVVSLVDNELQSLNFIARHLARLLTKVDTISIFAHFAVDREHTVRSDPVVDDLSCSPHGPAHTR
jgi:hypothetical protein